MNLKTWTILASVTVTEASQASQYNAVKENNHGCVVAVASQTCTIMVQQDYAPGNLSKTKWKNPKSYIGKKKPFLLWLFLTS